MSTLAAALQVLALLGSVALTLGAVVVALVAVFLGSGRWARRAGVVAVVVPATYAAALVLVALASSDRDVPPGGVKAFCEMDCHVVYDVERVVRSATGELTVTVREMFDRESISPRRGDAPLTPGERHFALIDTEGRTWELNGRTDLGAAPLFAELRPGDEHRAELSFRVPPGVRLRGLLVESDGTIERLLIGHERSPFHGKLLFALPIV